MTIDLESLREVRDYFADRQDAEQLAGESFPTPNEEMRLLVTVDSVLTELTARRARDAEAVRRQDMTTNDKLADALRNLIRAGKHLRNTVVETRGVAGMDDHDVAISDSIAALAELDAQPAPAPVQVGGLEGDARLAHDQCRAVAQMARALAEVHDARMSILATGRAPVEVIGQSSAEIMEWLGDALSGMDACDESDEWMDPVFDAAQARWPIAAHPPAPAADGAGELPPLPEPTCLGFRNPCGITQLPDMGIYGYTADQVRACQREAIAALRQPVTLREVTMEDMANACDAYRREQPASNDLAHPKAMFTALRAILPHGIPALASQQESRND